MVSKMGESRFEMGQSDIGGLLCKSKVATLRIGLIDAVRDFGIKAYF